MRCARSQARAQARCPGVDEEPCELCESTAHPEDLLICDGCDCGYHMTCLQPPLSSIPGGEWLCPRCTPDGVAPPAATPDAATGALLRPRAELAANATLDSELRRDGDALCDSATPQPPAGVASGAKRARRLTDADSDSPQLAGAAGAGAAATKRGRGHAGTRAKVLGSDSDSEDAAGAAARDSCGGARKRAQRSPSTDLEILGASECGEAHTCAKDASSRGAKKRASEADSNANGSDSDGGGKPRRRRRRRARAPLGLLKPRFAQQSPEPDEDLAVERAAARAVRRPQAAARSVFLDDAAEASSGDGGLSEGGGAGDETPSDLKGFVATTQNMTQRTPATDEQAMYMRSLLTPSTDGQQGSGRQGIARRVFGGTID